MALETATYLDSLVTTNPVGSDQRTTADDHIRLIKACLQRTFPNISAEMRATAANLNFLTGVDEDVQTRLDTLSLSLSAAIASLDTFSASIAALNSSVSANNTRIGTLSASMSSVEASISALNSSVSANNTRIGTLSASVSALELEHLTTSVLRTQQTAIAQSVFVTVTFSSAIINTLGAWSAGAADRFSVPAAATYIRLIGSAWGLANTSGRIKMTMALGNMATGTRGVDWHNFIGHGEQSSTALNEVAVSGVTPWFEASASPSAIYGMEIRSQSSATFSVGHCSMTIEVRR